MNYAVSQHHNVGCRNLLPTWSNSQNILWLFNLTHNWFKKFAEISKMSDYSSKETLSN